jgi:transposase
MKLTPETIEVSIQELETLVDRTLQEVLDEEGHRKLKGAIATLGEMARLLAEKETTLRQLRDLLLKPPTTEKTRVVLERAGIGTEQPRGGDQKPEAKSKPEKKKGHGRNPASAFPGARKIHVRLPSLKQGDRCPECKKGKVYPLKEPAWRVRIVGQAPVQATVYDLERMRCNLCQEVFTAPAPDGVGEKKYDETSVSMVALLKYGNGVPFYRLDRLQENLGMPLPASTQWEMVAEVADQITPVHEELIRQAAQGRVLHNDDTSVKILSLRREETDQRTGVFTSGIVSTAEGNRIALFFTGGQHAGENLADVLKWRASDLPPPIQMCDALSRNEPKVPEPLRTLLANCLAHGRRKFVEVASSFPPQCRYVLETLGEVYGYDEQAREQGLSPEERLRFHQLHSGPVMEKLHAWLNAQFDERNVEPNSGLGKAISYLLRHWERLTLFLRQAGAPLDNNICERALKKAILHRKNSLFYKTENGARVGDLFMSLIHSCELCGTNPFDYLTQLQRHAGELRQNPREWMPWNYQATVERSGATEKAA